jgi:hypothetical protein
MTDAVGSGSTQAAHVAVPHKVADASGSKDATAKPISSGIFGAASPSEIVKRVEKEIYLADSTMARTMKLYDYNAGHKPPPAMIAIAKANEEEQVLLQQMAAELKVRIRDLEADPKAPVAELKELKGEYDRLQKHVQGQGESGLTSGQVASEMVVDLEGHASRSEHALLRVELREQADSDFRYAVRSGDSVKISAYKQLLLEKAEEAVKAWQAAVDKVDKEGGKLGVIKNFKENLSAAEARNREIKDPDYGRRS